MRNFRCDYSQRKNRNASYLNVPLFPSFFFWCLFVFECSSRHPPSTRIMEVTRVNVVVVVVNLLLALFSREIATTAGMLTQTVMNFITSLIQSHCMFQLHNRIMIDNNLTESCTWRLGVHKDATM